MTDQDQSREAFEAWCIERLRKRSPHLEEIEIRDKLLCFADGSYYSDRYQAQFEAWQAALNHKAADVVLPEPVTWLIERSAFHVSPHGQDAESNEWLEEAHEPGEEGSFPVYTEQTVRALLAAARGRIIESHVPSAILAALNEAKGGNEWQGESSPGDLVEPACRAIASLAVVHGGPAIDLPRAGEKALTEYLHQCDEHSIVPDVGGAFAYAFRAFAELLAAAPSVPQGWIAASDQLPKPDETVLVVLNGKRVSTGKYIHASSVWNMTPHWIWETINREHGDYVSHWQPAPQPPKEHELPVLGKDSA